MATNLGRGAVGGQRAYAGGSPNFDENTGRYRGAIPAMAKQRMQQMPMRKPGPQQMYPNMERPLTIMPGGSGGQMMPMQPGGQMGIDDFERRQFRPMPAGFRPTPAQTGMGTPIGGGFGTNLGGSQPGGGQMFLGGSPNFDERTGQYRNGMMPQKPMMGQPGQMGTQITPDMIQRLIQMLQGGGFNLGGGQGGGPMMRLY